MAGTVPVMIDTLSAAMGHIQAGRLRPLAVSAPQRSPALPEIPTFAEPGYGDATGMNWFGFCATAGIPAAVADRWASELRAVLALPEITQRLESLGVEGTRVDPAMMTEMVGNEVRRRREVIRANNVSVG